MYKTFPASRLLILSTLSTLSTLFAMSAMPALAAPCLPVAELIEHDRQYEEALRVGNLPFLESALADNYVWVHTLASQIESKADVLARLKTPPAIPKSRSTKDVQAHTLGAATVLRGISSVEQWNADGKTWRTNQYQFMRTYVEVDGRCKLLSVQTMKVASSPTN